MTENITQNALNQAEISKNTQDFINYSLIFNELEEKQDEKPQKGGENT